MKPGNSGVAVTEWRENWPVVLSAMAGMALATVHAFSTGIMIGPLEQEFGWTRAQISSGPAIVAVMTVAFSPFMGMMIDRYGARRIGLMGAVLLCTAIALLSTVTSHLSWLIGWTFVAFAGLFTKPTVWTAAISSLFNSSRGLALAVVLCGTGIGSSATPVLSHLLVESLGWRIAYVGLGCFWAGLAIPMLYFLFFGAPDRQRLQRNGNKPVQSIALAGVSKLEGLLSANFFKLALGGFLAGSVGTAIVFNVVPILTFGGLSRNTAVGIAAVVGGATIVGRLTGGFLLDRINARVVGGGTVALLIGPCWLLSAFPGSVSAGVLAVILLGFALGAEFDAVAYLSSRLFGLKNFGLLFGSISGLLTFGAGVGPLLANYVYDVTQSYNAFLWFSIPAKLISSILFLSLGPYPSFAKNGSGQNEAH